MKSTGEVMGVAASFGEAFAKAQLSAGQILPTGGTVFFTVRDADKHPVVELARRYVHLGFKIVATEGTANVLEKAGMSVERVFKVKEGRPNAVDLIKGDRIHLIVNTPRGQDTFFDEKAIRRAAVLARIPTITTLAAAQAAADGIAAMQRHQTTVNALQSLHKANGR
jgi:carbamoyl-phosphate synthase large subunit